MKKIILILAGFCFLFSDVFGQNIEWQKCLGGSQYDDGGYIQAASDGGFIVAGTTSSLDGDVTGNHGYQDYWIVKLDNMGSMQWQKCYGGSNTDYATSIIRTADNGYFLTGSSSSNDGDVSGNHGQEDVWVVKTDSAGNLQWQKSLGGTQQEYGNSAYQTNDGGFIIAGSTNSDDGDVSGLHQNEDFWVVKLDSVGNLEWQKCLGGGLYEEASSVQQTANGSYIVAGYTNSTNGNVTGNHGGNDFWIVKLNTNGNIQWQKCLGGSDQEKANSIKQTADGGYIIAGTSTSADGDVTGNHGDEDSWVVKTDATGTIQWQKSLGGSGYDPAWTIQITDDGKYLVGSDTWSNDGDINNVYGTIDYWIVKLDTNGVMLSQNNFGGTSVDQARSIIPLTDNSYVIGGRTYSDNLCVNGNHGNTDFWIIKVTDYFNLIQGKLFIDLNSNQTQDTAEPAWINRQVFEQYTGRHTFSQQLGVYYLPVPDSGNFTVFPASVNYFNAVPVSHPAYFSGIHQTDSLNDFAFQPAGVFNDLCITITPMGNFRAGFNSNYMINYENIGTTTLNGTVIFFPDNDITFVSSNPAATSVTTDSVVWNAGTLTPFQTGSILVTVHVNAGTPMGTLINSSVVIEPVAGDANTVCNYNAYEVFVTSSVDPNAILVDRDTVFTTELSSPPYLNYVIYFQNTGNDTAFNARVLNNIPQTLDVNSFEFVASSHPLNIDYGAHSRLFTFAFDNILLPDSNVNEPASHGFIRYRIKPLSILAAGDSIKNNAAIYFDFNQPVMTDTAVTEIVLPTNLTPGPSPKERGVALAPNPATNTLTIKLPQLTTDHCQLITYDLFGREVLKMEVGNQKSEVRIDVSGFSQGVYFVRLESGEKVFREKFLKE